MVQSSTTTPTTGNIKHITSYNGTCLIRLLYNPKLAEKKQGTDCFCMQNILSNRNTQ